MHKIDQNLRKNFENNVKLGLNNEKNHQKIGEKIDKNESKIQKIDKKSR